VYGGRPAAATPKRVLRESYNRGPGGIPPGARGRAATPGHRKIGLFALVRPEAR